MARALRRKWKLTERDITVNDIILLPSVSPIGAFPTNMPFRIQRQCRTLLPTKHVVAQRPTREARRSYARDARNYINARKGPNEPIDVAILGGGITGLSAAHELLHHSTSINKPARITIFDSKPTLGGWLKSDFVDVPGGRVLLESGPRTLRPAGTSGMMALRLIHLLKLDEELLTCSKDSAAAKNRYVYYPDHLVRMPSSLSDFPRFLREPLASGLLPGVVKELMNPAETRGTRPHEKRHSTWDSTVSDVISERMHPGVTNLLSAVLHGIYAGDVEQLGFQALFPQGRYYLDKNKSLIRGLLAEAVDASLHDMKVMHRDDYELLKYVRAEWSMGAAKKAKGNPTSQSMDALNVAHRSSVFSFKRGLQQFSDTLVQRLRESSNVSIKTDCDVTSVHIDTEGAPRAVVKTAGDDGTGRRFTHVISTIPSRKLNQLLGFDTGALTNTQHTITNALTSNKSVTVMVVNLWYPVPGLLPVQGFGYLIPRDIPAEQNPELGLGVVFDSDAISGQDTVSGTKLTVMMGGHHYGSLSKDQLPTTADGVANAKRLVARHLGINHEPVIARASMHYECIPQYTPGHCERMSELRHALEGDLFKRRLIVAGSSYDGVGVNDCLRSGFSAGAAVYEEAVGLSRVSDEHPAAYVKAGIKESSWKFD